MIWRDLLDETAVARLLPADDAHFAKPVCDGLALFLEGLPAVRQAKIFSAQASLGPTAAVSARLGLLARSSPVLQKLGQILARDRRLAPELQAQLRELESLPPTVPLEQIEADLANELGPLDRRGVTLTPPALAEASVAVVIPFRKRGVDGARQDGVFKLLKPGIEEVLESELKLLDRVGSDFDQRCEELKIPHLDYQEVFQQVRKKLWKEVSLDKEQQNLSAAALFFANDDRVQIPALLDCCTARVTAMERIWGVKVTDHHYSSAAEKRRLAELIIDAMVVQPIFAQQDRALFHSDPHAGNLFLTTDGRLALLDWSLVGRLDRQARVMLVQLMLSAVAHDERRMTNVLTEMAQPCGVESSKLHDVVGHWLAKLRRGHFPGLSWLVGLLDEAVQDARLRLDANLMMFRKSLYTLDGVVADVGGSGGAFDKVLALNFLEHLATEWPARLFRWPTSRDFPTRISNLDLAQAVLNLPASMTRIWAAESSELLNAWRVNTKNSS
ncbi:AarF/ABC1/UbiB kinase family protein [Pirellulales bacterium]|nr:AarF/ABC1/UbiB kinase family protein [Pirellulales bacterium]